jgi:hypothetical protein
MSYLEGEDRDLPEVDPVDPADKWCLKYLTFFYLPSLSESFDNDANGLVSIREVNTFTSAIPEGWTLIQALAYWAAGEVYHRLVETALFISTKVGEWIANIITHGSNRSWRA